MSDYQFFYDGLDTGLRVVLRLKPILILSNVHIAEQFYDGFV